MNFREHVIDRIVNRLNELLIEDKLQRQSGPTSNIFYLIPNTGYQAPLRSIVTEPIEVTKAGITKVGPEPIAHVTFDGGTNDGELDTQLSHIVETLGVTIDIVLNKKIGVKQLDQLGKDQVRPLTYQVSDMLNDIQTLINKDSMASSVNDPVNDLILHDFYLEEWGFNEDYLGNVQYNILTLLFQSVIAHNPTS